MQPAQTTVDPDEAARFAAIAAEWWDETGKFRPLHQLNPARLGFIRDALLDHFARDGHAARPLAGLRVLDIGCGGGLTAEPIARLGAAVVGIDVVEESVAVAALHAVESGLAIDYRTTTAEALAGAGESFDAVLALEVVEHVADVPLFLEACARLVGPGGCLVLATINRTLKSLLLAKIGAEYVLRWLPVGTHDWRRFLRPSELAAGLRPHRMAPRRIEGIVYAPLTGEWSRAADFDVNYMLLATRPG